MIRNVPDIPVFSLLGDRASSPDDNGPLDDAGAKGATGGGGGGGGARAKGASGSGLMKEEEEET